MNILGIIAEFNPLHTGHACLIQNLRRVTGAEFCVVAMSGDYVQRGEPAFFSKYLRARAALSCGADLVLELPLSVSTGSAEYFAQGAVSLLDGLGCITHLGFGSESGDIQAFRLAEELLFEESEVYQSLLRKFLKAGMAFPKARYKALSAVLTERTAQNDISGILSVPDAQDDVSGILSLLDAPNNILGTEYMKALRRLRSSIIPVTVKRTGAGYHETINTPAPAYVSASGLRKAFLSSPSAEEINTLLENYVPAPCRALYLDALKKKEYVTFDDFFLPLYYMLQYSSAEKLSAYQDVTPEFSERLLRLFRQYSSVTELLAALKSKNLTSTRVNRSLLHILLQLTKDAAAMEKEQGFSLYARILGFRGQSQRLLSHIKKNTAVPLISKLADAPGYLSPPAFSRLQQTIKASELYRTILPGNVPGSEYTQKILIV